MRQTRGGGRGGGLGGGGGGGGGRDTRDWSIADGDEVEEGD